MDSGLALADVAELENQFRPAAEGRQRRDKGATEIYVHPKAAEALALVWTIRKAITTTDPGAGSAACVVLRNLAVQEKWI